MTAPENVEALVRIIEELLEELRRRGITFDGDLCEYVEYRAQNPKEDA